MNTIKNYFAHIMGYVTGAYAVVSTINPALIPPQYLPYVAAAGAVLSAVHNVTAARAAPPGLPPPSPGTIAKALFPFLLVGLLVASTVTMTACKTVPTSQQQVGITVAVDVAAGYAIQKNSSDPVIWKVRANEYKAIAVSIKAINDKGTASLSDLAAGLRPLIAKLPPPDQLAANALVSALTPYLEQQIQANPNLGATQTAVNIIVQAVIDACNTYGAT